MDYLSERFQQGDKVQTYRTIAEVLDQNLFAFLVSLTLEGMKKKKLHEGMMGWGVNRMPHLPPPPSIFKSIQPIDNETWYV